MSDSSCPDIRLVLPSLGGGGAERVAVNLGNEWLRQGKRVEFLLAQRRGVFLDRLAAGAVIFSPDAKRTLTALPALAIRLNKYAHVPALLFGIDLGVGLGGMKRLGLIRAPLIYREGSLPRQNVPKRKLWRYGALVNGVDGLIVQTNFALRELLDLGMTHKPARVIANPTRGPISDSIVRNVKVGPFALNVVAVGRLSQEKGFDRLLRAWPSILQKYPHSKLTIAGDGVERRELECLTHKLKVNTSVSLPGFITDVDNLYKNADLFILSSHYEGNPNALLEALLNGCRVVAAGGGGVAELLGAIGLGSCWLPNGEFESQLLICVERTLAMSASSYTGAIMLLKRATDISKVAREYWTFCETMANARIA